jgi:DNA-binding MarR family transcriptional regulator
VAKTGNLIVAGYAHVMSVVEERLGQLVKSLEQEFSSAKDAVLRPLGLTVPQYQALLVASEEPGISGAELARRCLVTPQTMTTVLGNLTTKGLIQRRSVPGQGRAMETAITPAGKRLLGRADKKVLEVESKLSGALSARDEAAFRKMLDRCREVFAAEPPAPAARPRAKKATTAKRATRKRTAKKTTKRTTRKRA